VRKIASIILLITFVILSITGVILDIVGPEVHMKGEVLTRTTEINLLLEAHDLIGYVFIIAGIVHTIINIRPIMSYFGIKRRKRNVPKKVLSKEKEVRFA